MTLAKWWSATMTRSFLFNVLGTALMGLAVWFLFHDNGSIQRAGLAAVMAGVCLVVGNFDRIDSLKFGVSGLEAKTRDVVAKAEVSIQQLQRLAVQLAGQLIEQNASAGRWGGSGNAEQDGRKANYLAILTELNVPKKECERAARSDRKWMLIDHLSTMGKITTELYREGPAPQPQVPNDIAAIFGAMTERLSVEGREPPPSVDFIAKVRQLMPHHSPLFDRWITSYDHYLKTSTLLDEDLWAGRDHSAHDAVIEFRGLQEV